MAAAEREGGGDPTQVHLWVARLDQDEPVLGELAAVLSDEERRRAAAIPAPVRRRRFVAGRGILRILLAAWCDRRPADVPIVGGRDRKPELGPPFGDGADGATVRFNLSHADGLLAVAIAGGTPVGVDVERLRPLRNADALSARILAAEERESLGAVGDPDAALLLRWTVKEAVLKGLGDGLARDPASVVVDGDARDRRPRAARIDGAPSAWTVRGFVPAAGHVGAVAVRSPGFIVRLRVWSASSVRRGPTPPGRRTGGQGRRQP